ncbi:MAG: ferrous iron transport protein B [Bacteroidales bacterium]|nr:ferrous iron transport protein B [Bacteroidales bacterium]
MTQSGFICNGDCRGCALAGTERFSGRSRVVALVGDYAAGLDGAEEALRPAGGCLTPVRPAVDDLGDVHPDAVLYVADSLDLEGSLYNMTRVMEQGFRMVLLLGRYPDYLATDHSVDTSTLSTLLGFPVVSSPSAVAAAVNRICTELGWQPRHIQGLDSDEEEHARRGFVSGALQATVRHSADTSSHTITQKIDAVLTNRWMGFPLMVLILFALFQVTFTIGAYPQRWIESLTSQFSAFISLRMPQGWLSSLLSGGIVQGVGSVLAFLPNIIVLFFLLSMLEDSGYMARAAYIMDSVMHRIGLHGNSFIPMLVGFGCNVPAIVTARGIQNPKDRALTMLMIPFMSCSARLPVYMLLVSAFFPGHKALVMIGLYAAGIALSILFAFIMKHTKYFRKGVEDYVSELPPYHLPRLKESFAHIWDRTKDYLQKITTVILAASVIIWALGYFPLHDGRPSEEETSCLASIGRWMEPATAPLGFDWKKNVCLLTGLPAKEAIVSTMGILYSDGDGAPLSESLQKNGDFTPASALAFMLFVLLYFPCLATISALRREIGWRWALFSVVHSLALAWLVAFAALHLFALL